MIDNERGNGNTRKRDRQQHDSHLKRKSRLLLGPRDWREVSPLQTFFTQPASTMWAGFAIAFSTVSARLMAKRHVESLVSTIFEEDFPVATPQVPQGSAASCGACSVCWLQEENTGGGLVMLGHHAELLTKQNQWHQLECVIGWI